MSTTITTTRTVTTTLDLDGVTLANGVALADAGTITQDGTVQFGETGADATALTIGAGAIFALLTDAGIGAIGAATISDEGLFAKTGIAQYQISDIAPVFDDGAAGIVEAAIGEIALQGGGTIAGTLAGAGAIDLGDAAGSNATYVIAAGAVIAVATLAVEGDGFSGVSDLSLGPAGSTRVFANALQLGGDSALLGGTMVIAGSATIDNFVLADGAAIIDTGTIIENLGGLQLGSGGTDSGSLTIAAGGVFEAVDDQGYGLSAGGDSQGSIVNDGLLEATSLVDDDVVGAQLTNAATGTIAVIDGGFAFNDNGGRGLSRTLINDGLITVTNGQISLIAVTASAGDSGAIDLGPGATATITGSLAASQTIGFTGTADALVLTHLAGFAGTITGFAAGDTIDLASQIFTGASFDAADGILTLTDGAGTEGLTLAGFADGADLAVLNDGSGGTALEILPGGGRFIPATTTTDGWTAGSGAWSAAGNWQAGEPGPTSLVALNSGTGTIAFDTTATIAAIADGNGTGLALAQTGGTLIVLNGGNFSGKLDLAAGVLADEGNVLQLTGATTIAGTIAGAGLIDLSGNTTLEQGADLAVAGLRLDGTLTLAADATYGGDLQALAGAIDLNGHSLTLAGTGTLTGGEIVGQGTLAVTGSYALGDDFTGNAVLIDAGTITEGLPASANVVFSNNTGTNALTIAPGGVYDDADGGFVGNIVNDGVIEVSDTYSGDVFGIAGTLFNDGIVSLAAGTGLTADFSTVTGTFEGAGTLSIGDDAYQSYDIAPAADLGAADLDVGQGGTFDLDGNAYTSALNIQLDYLAISGPGTLDLTGNTALDGLNLGPVLEGGAVLVDAGTMLLDGALALSGAGQPLDPSILRIAADATFAIVAIVGPDGISGGGIIENAGLFAQSFGDAPETIGADLVNTGVLDVLFGTLDLVDGASLGGTVEGGLVELGGGVFTIAPAAAITADIAVSGTAALSLAAGTATFAGGLALGIEAPGPLRYATLAGAGTLSVGAGTLGFVDLTGGAALLDTGLITLEDDVRLGNAGTDSAHISIAGGATLALAAGTAIGADGTAALDNDGTILAGSAQIISDVVNSGVLITGPGATVTIGGAITGTGLIIDDPSTLILAGPVAAGQIVSFAGGGIVELADPAAFAGIIAGFDSATALDIPGQAPGVFLNHSFAGGVLTLDTDGGDFAVTFANPATLTGAFSITSDGTAGSLIEEIPCFVAGTRLMTPLGERKVEAIEVGDIMTTVRPGGPAARRVIWVGRRTLRLATPAQAEVAGPIRITAGAFADGVPARDLRVSPRHAVMIGNSLFEAQSLVNGATILRERGLSNVTYHHVELDGHDIMLAEGLPAESFLDTGNRHMFGAGAGPREEGAPRDGGFCLKLVRAGPALSAARAGLLARAAALGFVATESVRLEVRAGGRRLRPIGPAGGTLYRLPAGAESVALISPAAGASDTAAEGGDGRRLGVALKGMKLIEGRRVTELDLASPAHAGLYPPADGAVWTDGAARLALPDGAGGALLSFGVVAAVPRLVRAAQGSEDAGWHGAPRVGDLLAAWE